MWQRAVKSSGGGGSTPTSIDSFEIQSPYTLTKNYSVITLVYCNASYEATDYSYDWLLDNTQADVRKGGSSMSVSGQGTYSVASFYNCTSGQVLSWSRGLSQRTLFIGEY